MPIGQTWIKIIYSHGGVLGSQEAGMKVKALMHKGAMTVESSAPLTAVARKMRDFDVGAVPVTEGSRLVGMITDRDITCRALAAGQSPASLRARDAMSTPVASCGADDDIRMALRKMTARKVRRLPVIDKAKKLVGMLSLGDISHGLSRQSSGQVLRSVSGHHR